MKMQGLYLDISITPFISLSLCSTVPGSTIELYGHISNLSITSDTSDRQMPVRILPQLHHRRHIHTKYSHVERSPIMSENTEDKQSQCMLLLMNIYSCNVNLQSHSNPLPHVCICTVHTHKSVFNYIYFDINCMLKQLSGVQTADLCLGLTISPASCYFHIQHLLCRQCNVIPQWPDGTIGERTGSHQNHWFLPFGV